MRADLAPFHCTYTPAMAELIARLDCSLMLSTYQAGKVICLSSDGERITQLPRTFDTPMGLALNGQSLAIACKNEIVVLADSPELAHSYPRNPGCYDSLYVPRSTYYTGQLALHDLAWVGNVLIGVNTAFSCLCVIDHQYNFKPVWQPDFISALAHEDRCHLNGMAADGKQPRYVTALGQTDMAGGWRDQKHADGVLVDVATRELVLEQLPMPHSPRLVDGELYMLLSATGEVVKVDAATGRYVVINQVNGFVRGMSHHQGYLFVGVSKLRKSHTFGDLPLAQRKDLICGIVAIHLASGAIVGELAYDNSCEEIYEVAVMPGKRRPNILRADQTLHQYAIATPDSTYWAKLPEQTNL